MPRKRATRAPTTRAKPKLHSLGEDIVNGMAPSEREEKLENYVKDFDLKAEDMRLKLAEELKHIEEHIKKSYCQIRLSLSARERNLTVAEYMAGTAEVEDVTDSAAPQPERIRIQTVLDIKSKYAKSARKIEPILEEDGAEATVKKVRKGAKTKAGGVSFNPEPTPLNRYVTPATGRNASALGWNTPLVTPKFDPRLPITPALKRQALAGEVIISMQGSPIEVNSSTSRSRTKTLQIPIPEADEDIEESDFEIPENLSKKNLQQVMNLLSNVMKRNEEMKK